jgi:hypothetical protein
VVVLPPKVHCCIEPSLEVGILEHTLEPVGLFVKPVCEAGCDRKWAGGLPGGCVGDVA